MVNAENIQHFELVQIEPHIMTKDDDDSAANGNETIQCVVSGSDV